MNAAQQGREEGRQKEVLSPKIFRKTYYLQKR
jgi:hypothetical protein